MYRAKIPAFWTQLEGAASQMPLSCHRPRNYVTHFTGNRIQEKILILKKYLVSCLLGFLSFGVHLAVLSFSCATEGPTSVIPQWQKGKCESESTLGDTRRGYSVNCTPARLTLLREECRRGFACMIRYAAEIILLTVVLGRISYTAAITPSRYSSVEEAAVGRSG